MRLRPSAGAENNQRKREIPAICWLTSLASRWLFEHVDEFLCRPTDPSKPLANDLGSSDSQA